MSHSSESSLPHRKSLDRLWIVVADGGHARVLAVSADRVRMEVMRAFWRSRRIVSGWR